MSAHLALGVIGHVDHGKTSLVKALSGMETDRLKEERERGMSIVLGFAFIESAAGMIELIDVPGHENFVHTMIAGATGIDAALLAVDVREGVKPQTAEHLAITQLIGVRRGVVAVTKCDLAGQEERAAALARLRGLLKGSYLEQAPAVFVSVRSGEGLQELNAELGQLLNTRIAPPPSTRYYLPVDRAFSMAGSGTVVTGTLRLGCLRAGDEIELMPTGSRATVRQLQRHGRTVDQLLPGQRAGVNLKGVKLQEVKRGDVLASVGLLQTGTLLDVQLTLLPGRDKSLPDGQALRLLFGTTEVGTRVRLLSDAVLQPGQTGFAQLRTARPVAAAGEPFILRSLSPPETIGGGRFIDPAAPRRRRSDPAVLARLQVLAHGSNEEVLAERLKAAGYGGIAIGALAALCGLTEEQALAGLSGVAERIGESQVIFRPFLDALGDMVFAALLKFHRQHPARVGAPLAYCRSALPRTAGESVFRLVLSRLCAAKRIDMRGGLALSFGYDPFSALNENERRWAAAAESRIRAGGLTPPDMDALLDGREGTDARERCEALLHLLAEQGRLLMLPAEDGRRKIVFHHDAVVLARSRMRQAFPPPAQFTVSECRTLLGSSRKFIVPLLEYFDGAGYTKRRGDQRALAEEVARR